MTESEQAIFNLGVKAGLQAAINLLSDRAHCEHDRYELAFAAYDEETTHEALIRRGFAEDILIHLGEIEPGNINGRYPKSETVMADMSEFNPHSDLPFELIEEEEEAYCQNCGSTKDLKFTANPYASEIGGDDTPGWYCDSCLVNSAMDI